MGLDFPGTWAKLCSMSRQCVDLCHNLIPLVHAGSPAKKQELLNLRQQAQELSHTEAEISIIVDAVYAIGRSFSSTKRGYVGWMPEEATMGDEIWVFHGCRVPFVLRPADDRQGDERAYRLIGDCYLHGLMSSEASARIAGETQQIKLV